MDDRVDVVLVVGQASEDLVPLHLSLRRSINSLQTLDGFSLLSFVEEFGGSRRIGKVEEHNYREEDSRGTLC